MEVNAQLLGGAAVTVFLALIFFGVVVLWDVALALRSVGDKIDKLEDNIDDDLTDIGHSLDNISNGRVGGGGGTQLHLSGGTISSGPSPGQGQGQPTRAAQDPGTQAASGGPQPSEPRQTTQQPRGGSGDAGGVEAATDSDAGIGPRRADTVAGETRATDTGGVDEGMAAARAADRASVAGEAEPAADGTGVAEADEPSADLGPEPTAPDAEPTGTTPDDGPATAPAETASDSDTARPPDAGDTADEPDVDAATETETGTGAATDGTASDRTHPRAARNRGRFVASPDRTAWYAVRLDRDAIADSRPTIAGELTDGSETDGGDAAVVAEPIESTATDETAASTGDADATETDDSSETTDDSVVAAPPAETADGEPTDRGSTAPADGDASIDGDPETVPVESDVGIDGTDDGETDADSDEDETVAGGEGPVTDERNSVPDDSEGRDEVDGEGEHETDGEAIEFDADDSTGSRPDAVAVEETDPAAGSPADAATEATTDDGEAEPAAETDDASDGPPAETGLEPVETDAETAEADPDEGADRSNEPDRESDAPDAVSDDEQAVDAADPLAGDVTAFEFDDEDLEDVTVEEAVETINEDAPAPELSSHQFDVSAEVYGSDGDGDGADPAGVARDDGGENTVLTYEFDTDTVEISGSTKRLLQYQLRSFADRDATPEADVTIGRDRIVIEIPDSDGDAVQRWSEAAVDIIDRTLYLSDNSSDDS